MNNYPYFSHPRNAEIVMTALSFGRVSKWFYLISFVIMPDHLHLIIVPRQKNISQSMHSIKSFSSNEINKLSTREGQVWQSSFRDFTIYSEQLLLEKITYIQNNPVTRELVSKPELYNLSSAGGVLETDIAMFL
jgi:REP element-mobilizing transposase RayT